ncbi:quinone oxidoreductase family protein [Jatrophihabitans sp.]|uniref:quinone oxidoreductase family protein n=1 Tax=Jatrophihabitans sp. TaxID=1932789 RepID=UPI002C33D71F|nr:quinone oxidoreductase [Jatrophihabitans sp.]
MATQTTDALVVTEHGGSEVLRVEPREIDQPGPGQLLVQVAAAGVNFIDTYQREGVYRMPTPFVLGSEGAGVVLAVGDGVTVAGPGDRVCWSQTLGSAAGLALVPDRDAVPVPEGVPLEQAAAVMLQGMTAHYLVNDTYPVQAGDTVLVHAGAGGVGQLLIQLVKAKDASVITTVSTEEKAAKVRALGADHVLNYTEISDLAAAVRELTGGEGVAAVYDGVGKSTFDASLASLRVRGTLAIFGAASGQVPPFNVQRLNTGGSLFLTRPTLSHHLRTREELLLRAGAVLNGLAFGGLQVEIGGRYPLAEAARAYDDLENRRSTGKLLLIP